MIENAPVRRTRNYSNYILNILSLLVIALLALYLYHSRDALVSLRNIKWQQILWIIILDIVSFLIGAMLNQSLINHFDVKVSFLDCILLQYVNNFLNKILPTIGGGAAFRAIYLKRKYQFSYAHFVSTVAGLYVISFSSVAIIGIFCLLVIYIQHRLLNWVILLAFIGLLLPCLIIIFFSPKIPESNKRFLKVLKSITDGWNVIKQDRKLILIYAVFSILLLLLSAIQTLISYQALGRQVGIIPVLFLSTLAIILAVLNFTPDGIGVKEGIYIFSASLVQMPDDILVLGSLILRAVSFCTTLIIGGISYWILMRELKASGLQTIDVKPD